MITVAAVFGLMGAIILGLLMNAFLDSGLTSRQKAASEEKLQTISSLLDDMNALAAEETANFDNLNLSKAETAAFMIQNADNYDYSDESMEQLRSVMDVYNVLVIDKNGRVICSALENHADYSRSRFNQLRAAFENETSEPFTISGDVSLRYYGAKIDERRMLVVVRDTAVLEQKLVYEASLGDTLEDVHVGQDGIVMAISPLDYTFLYHPDSAKIGESAVALGADVSLLSDGVSGYIPVGDVRYYCSTMLYDDMYIVCAVPEAELTANRTALIAIAEVIYVITVSILILYAFFASREKTAPQGKAEFRRHLGGRLSVITAVGAVIVLLAVILLGSLFSLSRQSITNSHRLTETFADFDENDEETDYITEQYNESYLEKAQLLALVVENVDRSKQTLDFMATLADKLQVEYINIFDLEGKTTAASSSFWSFTLSEDPSAQSYEFRNILNGSTLQVVQDPQVGDDGILRQYVGVAIQDENYETTGIAEIGIVATALQNALSDTGLADVLSDIQTGNKGFVFAVDAETGKFEYYPDSQLIGQDAESYGIPASKQLPGFNDFITIDGTNYYCLSGEHDGSIIYIAVPMKTLNSLTLPTALVTFFFCLVWMAIITVFLSMTVRHPDDLVLEEAEFADSIIDISGTREMIDVDRGDGKLIKTRSILTRFSGNEVAWSSKTAGQKVGYIFQSVLTVAALAFLVMVIFADSIFTEDSLFMYILRGSWQKGFNIFGITKSVVLIIVVVICAVLLRRLIMWFADKLGAKGETVCRLLSSFVKFGAFIGLIYACLAELGCDTSVLLTSAGILSIVVGLGANSLIKDILAGLMIIFEGTFQVGDIVTVGGFRGTVIEIGLRTTKIKEGAGNIKIFENSGLGDVLNMTKDFSVVGCEMSIEYGEDLRYVEKILEKEFPKIKAKLPAIKDGPFYKGVSALGDNSVDIKIVAKCNEKDRLQLDRDLRRALKLVFDEYQINVPYPQVVLNQPCTTFHQVSSLDEKRADKFEAAQGESSRDVVSDGESQG